MITRLPVHRSVEHDTKFRFGRIARAIDIIPSQTNHASRRWFATTPTRNLATRNGTNSPLRVNMRRMTESRA